MCETFLSKILSTFHSFITEKSSVVTTEQEVVPKKVLAHPKIVHFYGVNPNTNHKDTPYFYFIIFSFFFCLDANFSKSEMLAHMQIN